MRSMSLRLRVADVKGAKEVNFPSGAIELASSRQK